VTAQLGLQQAKSARARDAICGAAINVLADVGYAETSIVRVAQLAGVSKGAVQHHFPSKEDLIAATVDSLLLRTVQGKDSRPINVETALMNAWQRFINTAAYRALMEVLNASRTDKALANRITDELVEWGHKLDQQSLASYKSKEGDDQQVIMLLNMTRSFMRGLLIQEHYGVDQATTLNYVKKWIELVAPLLELRD
jgi:AcrR family transcriptional regulator